MYDLLSLPIGTTTRTSRMKGPATARFVAAHRCFRRGKPRSKVSKLVLAAEINGSCNSDYAESDWYNHAHG